MKKFFLSAFVLLASAGYVVHQYLGGSASAAQSPVASVAPSAQTVPSGQSGGVQAVSTPTPAQTVAPASASAPVAAPAPAPQPAGQYIDGTYTGSPADAYYGTVQVRAIIRGGKLVTVNFLQYPSDRSTSRYVNGAAMPMLETEAIQAQSASVSGVSGATDTSAAFVESLGSALAQAKNS